MRIPVLAQILGLDRYGFIRRPEGMTKSASYNRVQTEVYSPLPKFHPVLIAIVLKYSKIAAFRPGSQHFDSSGKISRVGHCDGSNWLLFFALYADLKSFFLQVPALQCHGRFLA
jgi:hypothetical protein